MAEPGICILKMLKIQNANEHMQRVSSISENLKERQKEEEKSSHAMQKPKVHAQPTHRSYIVIIAIVVVRDPALCLFVPVASHRGSC